MILPFQRPIFWGISAMCRRGVPGPVVQTTGGLLGLQDTSTVVSKELFLPLLGHFWLMAPELGNITIFSMLQNIVGLMVVRHILLNGTIIHVISCDFMNCSNMSLTSWARPNSFKFHVCWIWINCWKWLKYSKMNWCLGCPNSNTM